MAAATAQIRLAATAAAAPADGVDKQDLLSNLVLDQTLGEGTYGKVKLGIHRVTGRQYAVKEMNLTKMTMIDIKKEVAIHRFMKHPNIVELKCFFYTDTEAHMVLHLCDGGELFDRIEPDVGLHKDVAHFYFRQLISAVEYVHSIHCAHRDIKPENLLLDTFGNLKLTDFGLATIYSSGTKTRVLARRCGTPPYISPEVLKGSYMGLSADMWSFAVVLVTMLSGSLPWDKANTECEEFASWMDRKHNVWPWGKIIKESLQEFALLKKMLSVDLASWPSIQEVQADSWFRMETKLTRKIGPSGLVCEPIDLLSINPPDVTIHSQAEPSAKRTRGVVMLDNSLTQPSAVKDLHELNNSQHMISSSAPSISAGLLPGTCAASQPEGALMAGVPRIKRQTVIVSELSVRETLECLCQVLDRLGFRGRWTLNMQTTTISVETVDLRKEVLRFAARAWGMEDHVFVEFRRTRGDGLSFKRCFKAIKNELCYLAPGSTNASQEELGDSQVSLFSPGGMGSS
jgi:serine/threonine-protein kinase Chk1